jgi:hypothetical protein
MASAGGSCQEMEPAGDFAARALTAPTHFEMSKARRPATPFPATCPRGVYCSLGVGSSRPVVTLSPADG